MVDRDLKDGATPGLSTDGRFAIAYNAALQAAAAALYAAGYAPAKGQSNHVRTIQSLAYTLGVAPAVVQEFERYCTKRHKAHYTQVGVATATEADEMFKLAEELRDQARQWIKANYPHLLP